MKYLDDFVNKIICGDCLEVLKELPDNCVDSIVTDPPAGINFMGRDWDNKGDLFAFQNFIYQVFSEAIRVLKPGGHALVWALPRTAHHTAMGIERAGFEIRDKIYFVFGSGFPKSLNISKTISKKQGAKKQGAGTKGNTFPLKHEYQDYELTDGAKQWNGFGTALKPAVEEWILARKPISEKTIAQNVLKWGTGGLNIDECRVDAIDIDKPRKGGAKSPVVTNFQGQTKEYTGARFPSHLILDGSEEVEECLPKNVKGWSSQKHNSFNPYGGNALNKSKTQREGFYEGYDDSGSASRFFQHCPITEEDLEYNRIFYGSKASKKERNMGCEGLEEKESSPFGSSGYGNQNPPAKMSNYHPTVKSLSLMRYLCKLITPKNGIVLDPFLGSGTTAIACILEGFNFIGIEKEKEYCQIAEARIQSCRNQPKQQALM